MKCLTRRYKNLSLKFKFFCQCIKSRINMWAQLLLLCFTSSVALAAIGGCPDPKLQQDFDLEKFSGTWYILEATASVDRATKKCSSYIIEKKQGAKASLLHKYISTITDKSKNEYSDITTPKKSEPAKLLVSPLKGTVLARKWPIWVVDTDYENYAILFSCQKLVLTHTEEVFILSRTKTMDDKQKTELYDLLKKRDLNQKNLVEVNQKAKDCQE